MVQFSDDAGDKIKLYKVLKMTISGIAALVYGTLSIVGGIIGYKNAGSKVSLMSGVITGILLVIGALAQFQGQKWGLYLALFITLLLLIVFAIRLTKTRKFMPAGLMVILGVVTLLLSIIGNS